ncbi:MAG TPA: M50 family metallopeptidase [Gaiella sp.]|jgi:regulator of sigma E protease|nr:M50 family metallopeptidase [Gaiella sp.]
MTIFVAIVGLGVLIFVHELGHFVVSLALGMRPRRFYIGFPPAIWKTTRNGIEYGLGAIPLGGFVKIPGMHRPSPVDVDTGLGRALSDAPSLSGETSRLRSALAAGDHDAARDSLRVLDERIAESDLPPHTEAAARRGLDDLGDSLGPNAYWRAPTWKRVAAIVAGPAANIVLALVLFTGLFMTSVGAATTTVERVTDGSPAASMGLTPGDRIVSIDGTAVQPEDISQLITGSDGRPLTVVVARNGERVTLPPTAPRQDEGAYRLGFVLAGEGLPLHEAAVESLDLTWQVTRDIGAALGRLVTGEGRDQISSPVGIVQGSSDAAKQSAESFLFVLGLISLSIALLNLLPLLPLDGGHIVFAVAEGIRGRAVRREVYERVSVIGIGLVLLLFVIGLSNDIGRLS